MNERIILLKNGACEDTQSHVVVFGIGQNIVFNPAPQPAVEALHLRRGVGDMKRLRIGKGSYIFRPSVGVLPSSHMPSAKIAVSWVAIDFVQGLVFRWNTGIKFPDIRARDGLVDPESLLFSSCPKKLDRYTSL